MFPFIIAALKMGAGSSGVTAHLTTLPYLFAETSP